MRKDSRCNIRLSQTHPAPANPPHNQLESVAVQVGLKAQDDLDIEVQDGNVLLKPHLRRLYRLEDLVKRISPKNVHGEVDRGTPVGREIW